MRPSALLLAAAALLVLTACSGEDDSADAKPSAPAVATSAAADTGTSSDAEQAAGIPDAPTGANRAAYLAAVKAVDPRIVEDEEKAIDAGRNQCMALAGGANTPDHFAAERFGNDARPLTDAQGKALNEVLRKTLCPA